MKTIDPLLMEPTKKAVKILENARLSEDVRNFYRLLRGEVKYYQVAAKEKKKKLTVLVFFLKTQKKQRSYTLKKRVLFL